MRCVKRLALAGLVILFAAAQAQARPSRRKPRPSWRPKVADIPRASDAAKPLEWMTDFDLAAALAAREKRGMMVLFTTQELMRNSTYCRFHANSVRRAVRSAKAVPVRLLPPVRLAAAGLPKGEIAKREERFKKARKRYRELVKRFGVRRAPCLVLTAPDAASLKVLVVPADDRIREALGRLGEMIAAHQKAAAEKDGDGKLAAKPKAEEPAAKPAEKPVEKKPDVDPEDDF